MASIPSAARAGGGWVGKNTPRSKMPYATETGLSSARVGRSLAHARLITPILELETCSSSFARKLSDSLTTNKSEKTTKCEQVYVKLDCVSAMFVFPTIQ